MRPVGAVFSDDPLIFQGDAPKASRGLREIASGVFFFFFLAQSLVQFWI